jgi:hypothetical protein
MKLNFNLVLGESDGGHGALLRGAAGWHEAPLGGHGRPGVLRQIQRVPAQRQRQIVSSPSPPSTHTL